MTEETPRQRDRRLRHLARVTNDLARRELRRIESLVMAASDEEIMMAAQPALKRLTWTQSFASKKRFGVKPYDLGYRYEVKRPDIERLVAEGRLKWGNQCRSFVVVTA